MATCIIFILSCDSFHTIIGNCMHVLHTVNAIKSFLRYNFKFIYQDIYYMISIIHISACMPACVYWFHCFYVYEYLHERVYTYYIKICLETPPPCRLALWTTHDPPNCALGEELVPQPPQQSPITINDLCFMQCICVQNLMLL